jgi:hypothetical protein
MAETTTHKITIAGALDHRGQRLVGKFDARIEGGPRLVHAAVWPLYDSARELLARGLAKAEDAIELRHRGSHHVILRGTVGAAARMAETAPQAGAGASNAAGGYYGGGHDPARW